MVILAHNVVAIILAGGKGTRLKELTLSRAKPAVSFAGKYRLIDFVLSNCTNSGIEQVGVITQYEPLELNSYIGEGSSWDLDVYGASLTVMGPYTSRDYGFLWQGGTAEAVILNMPFIEQFNPDHLLVLSADHIYKMDYGKIIDYHVKKGGDLTISTIRVEEEDTHRFGMMKTDEKNRILQFEEKPKQTESRLASMGIYVFNWKKFKEEIAQKYFKNQYDGVDFGTDVIPHFIQRRDSVFAFEYEGYWRDVGTVDSYWKAHMDLLDDGGEEGSDLGLHDETWPIFSKTPNLAPHHILPGAKVQNSWLNEGSMIFGEITDSIIGYRCVIERGTSVHKSVVMTKATIGSYSSINYAIIGDEVVLPPHTEIHGSPGNVILVTTHNLDEILSGQDKGV